MKRIQWRARTRRVQVVQKFEAVQKEERTNARNNTRPDRWPDNIPELEGGSACVLLRVANTRLRFN